MKHDPDDPYPILGLFMLLLMACVAAAAIAGVIHLWRTVLS